MTPPQTNQNFPYIKSIGSAAIAAYKECCDAQPKKSKNLITEDTDSTERKRNNRMAGWSGYIWGPGAKPRGILQFAI